MLDVKSFLSKCGIEGEEFFDKSQKLMRHILEENKKYNLTSIKDEREFWIKHICDSASIFLFYRDLIRDDSEVCDIGSGAGFPAFIIALGSKARVHAVESSQKKAAFIRNTASILGIRNLEAISWRSEEIDREPEFSGRYDIITARAVGKSEKICAGSSNMISKQGSYIFYKTPSSLEAELAELRSLKPNFKWQTSEQFDLPMEMGKRIFIQGCKIERRQI